MVKEPKMKERDAFIVVFDLNSEESLEKIEKVYEQIYAHHPDKDVPIIMVGNKLDKERVMSKVMAEKKAIIFNSPYMECSALTGENIEEVFHLIVRELRKK
jgi:small GTP-binding protein